MQEGYESLDLESRPDGVLLVRIRSRLPGQAANRSLHQEMGSIWQDVAEDPDVRVAVLTGDGPSFMPRCREPCAHGPSSDLAQALNTIRLTRDHFPARHSCQFDPQENLEATRCQQTELLHQFPTRAAPG